MGSEWSEEQAGPQGPAGGAYLGSLLAYVNAPIAYNGTAEEFIVNAFAAGGTLVAGSRYRITAHIPVQSTVAGDVARLNIRRGSSLGSLLVGSARVYLVTANVPFNADFSGIYDHSGADAAMAFNFTCQRAAGSGTISVRPTSTDPVHVELELVAAATYETM